ncbi:hypothetical protein M5K25_006385 [Dendrobium thyrsiflorum]|uniref:Uncharacterized protein n=1 Tax=Dendrobium thyrsiflorum TaxID=117978 RepID=A0ABD0VIN6_DENTH
MFGCFFLISDVFVVCSAGGALLAVWCLLLLSVAGMYLGPDTMVALRFCFSLSDLRCWPIHWGIFGNWILRFFRTMMTGTNSLLFVAPLGWSRCLLVFVAVVGWFPCVVRFSAALATRGAFYLISQNGIISPWPKKAEFMTVARIRVSLWRSHFGNLLRDPQDELPKAEGNDNLPLHGHQIVSLIRENEFSGFQAEEALQLGNLERRLAEMVWQDDSSGFISLLKHSPDHALESPCSNEDEGAASLLQLACKLDSVKCAQVLIEGQTGMVVNINEMDGFGLSPLHTAAEMLSAKCIDLLLRNHARTDLRSNDGDALLALEISLTSQRTHVSWSPDESVEELLASLKEMDLTAITLLAEATKDLTELSYMMAVEGRVVELAFLLVAADKLTGPTSVHGKNIYELVLEESLNLLEMAKGGHWSSTHGIYEKRQALLCQIELLHLFGVASMISWGNKKDLAVLLRAAQAGDELLVEVLIRKNLDANDTNEDGNSSLHCYLKGDTSSQDPRILRCLLKCGARVNQHNKFGLTPIHLASLEGNYESLQILLLHAPECVDILSVTNETPLFFAVKSNSADCVKLLLQLGANRDALNLRKQRPVDLAPSEDMRVILRTVYPKTLGGTHPSQEDDASFLSDEEHSEGMFHGFLELKADLAKLSKDTKIGISRYFNSPKGCERGSKCYYSHGEEAQRLEKSRLVEHNTRLLTCIKPTSLKDELQRKIFIGGLPPSVDSDDLKKFFEEEFGPVDDAVVIGTKVGNRVLSKGFGFLTFKQEDTMKRAVKAHFVTLSGKIIEIKSALPKCQMETSSSLSDQELFKEDPDEANGRMASLGDSNDQQVIKIGELPPWLVRFKKWFPVYLNKTCRRLGEGEWYPLSSLKGDFRATCGMELDHESIGFLKLSDFLRSLPGICKMHVISTGNGSPTHMVLRPFCSLSSNQSQQSNHASFVVPHFSSSKFPSPAISEISDNPVFSDESILHENVCVLNADSMQRSPNHGRWEHKPWLVTNPPRLGNRFSEYNQWKSAGLFEQPNSLKEIAAGDSTQQPFSFFVHQWDSGLIARGDCIICKNSPGIFIVSPYLHKVCHSCKKDFFSSFTSGSYYGGIQLRKPAIFYEEFPSLLEAAYQATAVHHLPSHTQTKLSMKNVNFVSS